MSTPSTEARPPAGKAAGGKKILGMPPQVAYLGLLVAAGGVAFFLWKRRQSGSAAAQTVSAGTTTYSGTNAAGEISTLQTELGDLQGQVAGLGTTTSKTSTTTGTGTATGTKTGTPAHTVATASGTQSLNKLAAAHGSTGPAALTFTAQYKPHKGAEETKYIHAGNAQARLPAGTVWWIPKKAG